MLNKNSKNKRRLIMQILFCDVDSLTKKYLDEHPASNGINYVICEKSLNDMSESELSAYYDSTDIISTFVYSRLTGQLLSKFKNLKMISTRSTGYNNVDLDYCREHNIKVVNVVGYGEITVAEFAVGLLLNLTRNIGFSYEKLYRGVVNVDEDMGIDLSGKTIGVIGTGAIGRHFARLVRAFGCKVLAYDLYPNQALADEGVCEYTDLEKIYKEADVISIHCPATKENYHMINADTIAKMKDGVYIINTARGDLIDTVALYNALVSKKVRGAGVDVLEYEDILLKNTVESAPEQSKDYVLYSLVNQKLLQLKNVIITPHIGFNSVDANYRILNTSMKNMMDFIEGREVKSVA